MNSRRASARIAAVPGTQRPPTGAPPLIPLPAPGRFTSEVDNPVVLEFDLAPHAGRTELVAFHTPGLAWDPSYPLGVVFG